MATPLWKEQLAGLGGNDSYLFRIRAGARAGATNVIYQGKAYMRPGASSVQVKINDICADYLAQLLETSTYAQIATMSFPVTFYVDAYYNSTWNNRGQVQFFEDWSYDYTISTYSTMPSLSFPINGRYDTRMPLVVTSAIGNPFSFIKYFPYEEEGGTQALTISGIATSNNADFCKAATAAGAKSAVFMASDSGLEKMEIGGNTYYPVGACYKYAVYYKNAYGGWDFLLIEGNNLEVDEITRYLTSIEYNNSYPGNRGTWNYANELTKKFILHTGYFTGDAGTNIHHLLNTTSAYLYDIAMGVMHPVTIANSTCEHRTFRNNGNKLVSYAIEVALAQRRERR